MPKVVFLQDFQGVETHGVFYTKGQIADVESSVAERCVADGRAEYVRVVKAAPVPAEDPPDEPEPDDESEAEPIMTSAGAGRRTHFKGAKR